MGLRGVLLVGAVLFTCVLFGQREVYNDKMDAISKETNAFVKAQLYLDAGDAAERQAHQETGNSQRYWYQNALIAYSETAGLYQSQSGSVSESMGSKACDNAKRVYAVLKSKDWHKYLGSKYNDHCKLKEEEEKKDEPIVEDPEEKKDDEKEGGEGCFVGRVYRNSSGNKKINMSGSPAGYVRLNEFNIPTRGCGQGFPGRKDLTEWFTIDFKGSIYVENAGEYTFKLTSDDGSRLYVNGSSVVDHDGLHSTRSKEGTVSLSAGYHRINVQYFQGPCGHIALSLHMKEKGGAYKLVQCREGQESPDCDDGDSVQLGRMYPYTVAITHPDKSARIFKQPIRQTDHGTAEAAASYYNLLYQIVKGAKDYKQYVSTARKGLHNMYDVVKNEYADPNSTKSFGSMMRVVGSGFYAGSRGVENIVEIEFAPIETEFGDTDLEMVAPITNAVLFYLQALANTTNGIAGLGKKINESAFNMSWIIPQYVIKGQCVPQMKCVDGEWVPSRDWIFKETKREEAAPILNPNFLAFLTLKQTEQSIEKYFKPEIERLEDNLAKYKKDPNCFCDEVMLQNYSKVDWPYDFDKCDHYRTQLANVNDQIDFYEDAIQRKEAEIKSWVDVEKPYRLKNLKANLNNLNATLARQNETRTSLINIRDAHETAGNTSDYIIYKQKVEQIDEQIQNAMGQKADVQAQIDELKSGKHLKSLTAELRAMQEALKKLTSTDKPSLEASIKRCEDHEKRVSD